MNYPYNTTTTYITNTTVPIPEQNMYYQYNIPNPPIQNFVPLPTNFIPYPNILPALPVPTPSQNYIYPYQYPQTTYTYTYYQQ